MKNFLLALFIAIVLMNCLGSVVEDALGMHLVMSDELLSPWENIAVFSAVGTVVLALGAVLFALLLAGVSAFWPIILIAIALYALKKRNTAAYARKSEHNMYHTL
ncbi:hypothetical protein [Alteromonas sp. P256]|uniref:hypothetical protein n=1 Tax=Alteromonas sp. P256 TaxID=3117399 RepID=UPI002FE1C1BA